MSASQLFRDMVARKWSRMKAVQTELSTAPLSEEDYRDLRKLLLEDLKFEESKHALLREILPTTVTVTPPPAFSKETSSLEVAAVKTVTAPDYQSDDEEEKIVKKKARAKAREKRSKPAKPAVPLRPSQASYGMVTRAFRERHNIDEERMYPWRADF